MLLGLDRIEHLGKAGSIVLAPPSFPPIDLGRIEVKVEKDSRALREGTKEKMPPEEIALPDQLAD
jgi:hypothetical protein